MYVEDGYMIASESRPLALRHISLCRLSLGATDYCRLHELAQVCSGRVDHRTLKCQVLPGPEEYFTGNQSRTGVRQIPFLIFLFVVWKLQSSKCLFPSGS